MNHDHQFSHRDQFNLWLDKTLNFIQVIYEWYQPSKSGMKYLYNIIQKSWRKYKISNTAQKRVSDSW